MQDEKQVEPKRRALGRGLESLLPGRPAEAEAAGGSGGVDSQGSSTGRPLEIALDRIDRNPFQTRARFDEDRLKELAASITMTGVVQPVVVRPGKDGRYTLIAGERRLLASRMAGRLTVPAVVREASDLQTMEITVIENLQREGLNPMEQARAYGRLSQEFHLTQEQAASRTGKDRATVGNFLRLLKLPEEVQRMLEAGELSFGHAKALLALPSPEAISGAAARAMQLGLNVRGTEMLVQGLLLPEGRPKPEKPPQAPDPNVRAMEERLQERLGLKVVIQDGVTKGRVVIEYNGLEDFDTLMQALGIRL